jgi:7SK snRNA methylphosphate capping enzyme
MQQQPCADDGRDLRRLASKEQDDAGPAATTTTTTPPVRAASGISEGELTRSQKKNLKRRRKLEQRRSGGGEASTTTAAAAQAAQAVAASGAAASAEDNTVDTNNAKRLRTDGAAAAAAPRPQQQQQQQQQRRPPLPTHAGHRRQPQHQQPVPSFAGSADHGSAASPTQRQPWQQPHHHYQGASSARQAELTAHHHHSLVLVPGLLAAAALPPLLPLSLAAAQGRRGRQGSMRGPDLSGVARLVALELPVAEEEEEARKVAAAAAAAAAKAAAAALSPPCLSPPPQPHHHQPPPRSHLRWPASPSLSGGGQGRDAPCRTNLSGDVILVSRELGSNGGNGGEDGGATATQRCGGRQQPSSTRRSYPHGNYPHYYGYRLGRGWLAEHHRSPDEFDDPRLAALARACPAPPTAAALAAAAAAESAADTVPPLVCAWLKGARVLDVGCNEGLVTLAIAAQHGARSVRGVDLDRALVRRARGHLAAARRAAGGRYGALCARLSEGGETGEGGAPPPASAAPPSLATARAMAALRRRVRALSRVRFAVANWPDPTRARSSGLAANATATALATTAPSCPRGEAERYDVVTCLSVTKWVHLNGGDAALLRLFARARRALVTGGLLVLEPQPWRSYRSAARKLGGGGGGGGGGAAAGGGARQCSEPHQLSSLRLRPDAFVDVLRAQFGFELVATVRPRVQAGEVEDDARVEAESDAAAPTATAAAAAAAPAAAGALPAVPPGDAEVAAAALRGRGFSDRPIYVLRKLAPPEPLPHEEEEEDCEEEEEQDEEEDEEQEEDADDGEDEGDDD